MPTFKLVNQWFPEFSAWIPWSSYGRATGKHHYSTSAACLMRRYEMWVKQGNKEPRRIKVVNSIIYEGKEFP